MRKAVARPAKVLFVLLALVLLLGTSPASAAGTRLWLLRNSNSAGAPDITFEYGSARDPVGVGDFDGDVTPSDTAAVVRPNLATGNWQWLLRNSNSAGNPDITFEYGSVSTDIPVGGDWDGNGTDTVGVARVDFATGSWNWLLRNTNSAGNPDINLYYGSVGSDVPFPGDWDGTGGDSVGVVRATRSSPYWTWLLRNANTAGNPDLTFQFGSIRTDIPLAGNWDGTGGDTAGVARVDTETGYWSWLLRNASGAGSPDVPVFEYGSVRTDTPLVGDFDGDGADSIGVARRT